jgi:hypothetical protein
MASQRGVNTRQDDETLQFVGRMVVTLENCAHEILDPLQTPQRFFQQLHRAVRSAAVYLDLSPPTGEYFQQLAQIGETEFDALLAHEQQTLLTNRELTIHDNLSIDVQRVESAFQQLRRLEEALEGKYVDYRVSPALEALNFFFDRRSDLFYQSIARPARPQQFHDEFTFVFASLRLEGKQRYRLILMGTPEAQLAEGDSLRVEIRFNVGAGQPLGPVYGTAHCEMPGQRNFAIDFDAPAEVLTIADLRVTLPVTRAIKSSALYERRFLYPGAARPGAEEPRPAPQPPPPPPESKPVRGGRLHRLREE